MSLGLNKEGIIPSSAVKLFKVYAAVCVVMKEVSWGGDLKTTTLPPVFRLF